jgi:4-hydroxythreonine-4-phosphate dehydrogenase
MKKTKPDERPYLGLTMGDPAGIGPEILAKALANKQVARICRPIVIGSRPVMEATVRSLRLPVRVVPVTGHDTQDGSEKNGEIRIFDPLSQPLGRFRIGRAAENTGAASVRFIETAVRLARAGCIGGIVTAPINKEAINLAGFKYPGHTELLADLTRTREVGMMIVGGPLRVMFVTTHVALRDLSEMLTSHRVTRAIRLAHRALHEFFGVPRPRIGLAALNPHAGEGGLFGNEERKTILPAAKQARRRGIQTSDPLPADTLFGKAARGEYDGVVAMYHDQGLIALKLLAFGRCVNLTVGLPLIRTSVDHGTAYDIAGKGLADPGSLMEAVTLASRLAVRRRGKKP